MSTLLNYNIDTEIEKLHLLLETKGTDIRSIQVVTPEEIATCFRVNHHTVTRWLQEGTRFPLKGQFLTLGGHHRVFRVYLEKALFDCGMHDRRERENLIDAAMQDRRVMLAMAHRDSIEHQLRQRDAA